MRYNLGWFYLQLRKLGGKVMAEEFMVTQALHKSFNEHKVVNGVSFTIYKGEIFGLLVPYQEAGRWLPAVSIRAQEMW